MWHDQYTLWHNLVTFYTYFKAIWQVFARVGISMYEFWGSLIAKEGIRTPKRRFSSFEDQILIEISCITYITLLYFAQMSSYFPFSLGLKIWTYIWSTETCELLCIICLNWYCMFIMLLFCALFLMCWRVHRLNIGLYGLFTLTLFFWSRVIVFLVISLGT